MSEYYGQYEDYTKDDAWWNQQGHHQGDLWNDTAGGPGNQSAYRSAGSYGTSHYWYLVRGCFFQNLSMHRQVPWSPPPLEVVDG